MKERTPALQFETVRQQSSSFKFIIEVTMSEFDKNKVQKWITEYWSGPQQCQVCKSTDWVMLDNIWEIRKFEGGGLVIGSGPILPVVALMCNVCGQMLFFNAFAVRALDQPQSTEVQDEP